MHGKLGGAFDCPGFGRVIESLGTNHEDMKTRRNHKERTVKKEEGYSWLLSRLGEFLRVVVPSWLIPFPLGVLGVLGVLGG